MGLDSRLRESSDVDGRILNVDLRRGRRFIYLLLLVCHN